MGHLRHQNSPNIWEALRMMPAIREAIEVEYYISNAENISLYTTSTAQMPVLQDSLWKTPFGEVTDR